MKIKRKTIRFLDVIAKKDNSQDNLLNIFESSLNTQNSRAILYSHGKKSQAFFTEDSKLYITPKEAQLIRLEIKLDRQTRQWDNLSSRVVRNFVKYRPTRKSYLLELLEKKLDLIQEQTKRASENLWEQFSLVRLWNLSIVGSILFGVVTMTFVYRYLGQGASASTQLDQPIAQALALPSKAVSSVADTNKDGLENINLKDPLFLKQLAEVKKASDSAALEEEIYGMVKGYPIEKMVPYIAKQDRTIAAFMVAIAKKESNWGKRVPLLDGEDCYNYFGYRGIRDRMGTGMHTCFDSPEDAANTIAKRVKTLVEENERNTPAKMVVWKCGNSCAATGGQLAANKWISDVDMYFQKFKI